MIIVKWVGFAISLGGIAALTAACTAAAILKAADRALAEL